jgi:hypothetical protein
MKNLTIISLLLISLTGCIPSPELKKCDVELNLTFTNDVDKLTTVTLEFTECNIETVDYYIVLTRNKRLIHQKAGYLGTRIIANDINYFTIESVKPTKQ